MVTTLSPRSGAAVDGVGMIDMPRPASIIDRISGVDVASISITGCRSSAKKASRTCRRPAEERSNAISGSVTISASPDGSGERHATPYLAGQSAAYLAGAIREWKTGAHHSGEAQMGWVQRLGDQDIASVSAYFESLGDNAH